MLFDDSRSMRVTRPGGVSRGASMLAVYDELGAALEAALRRKGRLFQYRFGAAPERLESVDALSFAEYESGIDGAIEAAIHEFDGTEVAAVIVLTDGARQSPRPRDTTRLIALGAPVIAIGVGDEDGWTDVSIERPTATRADSDDSPVTVRAPIRATGLDGREVIVEAILDEDVLASARLTLTGNEARDEARLEFIAKKRGWLEIEARVRLADDSSDPVPENDARHFLVDNREEVFHVLYLGGRPNWEAKFLRRAIDDDDALQLASLIRISGPETKFEYRGARSNLANPIYEGIDVTADMPRYDEALFLRFGLEQGELVGGYPERAEDLFGYDLVIWGEIEADHFSDAQMSLTREFVRKRGGSLLLLGGQDSFSEGGYGGTLIETTLPARLSSSAGALDGDRSYRARPTLEGLLSGAWSLDPEPEENARLWDDLPPLYGVNSFAMTRPGARVHAMASAESSTRDTPTLFAVQRYGEGQCATLATGSTWHWRLGNEPDDGRHARLWRQLVRSLARDRPGRVLARGIEGVHVVGRPTRLEFLVRDELYDERESLHVSVSIATLGGEETAYHAEESIDESGLYRSAFTSDSPGARVLKLSALDARGEAVAFYERALMVEDDTREYDQARYDPAYLTQLADATGGAFLPLARLSEAADLAPVRATETLIDARLHLWRWPGFYIALAVLLIAEWFLRRKEGYA